MGIYDREYYREDEPRGGLMGGSWSIVAQLIVVNVVFYLADMLLAQGQGEAAIHWLFDKLSARPESLWPPWYWWQFLSYGFAHDPKSLWHIVGNMLMLGMFGRHVEPIYGRKEFLRFYLLTLVLCSVVWAVKEKLFFSQHHSSLIGASGAVTAVFMLFVFHFPHQKLLLYFFIPVPAWLLGLFVLVSNLFAVRMPGHEGAASIAFDVHLVGVVLAFAYFRFKWRISNFWPDFDGLFSLRKKWRTWRTRSRLKLHDPESAISDGQLEAQADRVLAKLKAEGDESLTPAERRILEKYSDRLRQRKRDRNQT